jgi:hypothetical protein
MNQQACSLSILVARTDIPFIDKTIPAIVKACRYPFSEVVLFIDAAPLRGVFQNRPGIGTHQELVSMCEQLKNNLVVSRIEEIPYHDDKKRELYRKFFGFDLRFTHDFRGAPLYGHLYSIEHTAADYVVHFDSDMLLYSEPCYSWVEKGIQLIDDIEQVLFVSPLPGPPTEDGTLHQKNTCYQEDSRGFYAFKEFTSRKYLFSRSRLEQSMSYDPVWISKKRKLLSYITGKSALLSWELIVSKKLRDTKFIRADMKDPRAWTLHTPDHGPEFIRNLPSVIEKLSHGQFPASQRGHYDLRLHDWSQMAEVYRNLSKI